LLLKVTFISQLDEHNWMLSRHYSSRLILLQ